MKDATRKVIALTVLLSGAMCAIHTNEVYSNQEIKVVEPQIIHMTNKKELICDFYDIPFEPTYDLKEEDINILTNVLYGEARGLNSLERSAVIWCVLNRVDSEKFPNTIYEVVTAPNQFAGYSSTREGTGEVWESCRELVVDVLTRYYKEKDSWENVGRTLPKDYFFFWGNGKHNYFRKTWKDQNYWDWTLENPYE